MVQVVPRNGENGGGMQMTELEKRCVRNYTYLLAPHFPPGDHVFYGVSRDPIVAESLCSTRP